MLERQALWLGNWSLVPPTAGVAHAPLQARTILDAGTRVEMGSAWQHPKPTIVWFGSLTGPTIDVLETEDEALVFTVERLLSLRTAWRVRDSEGNSVGTIRGKFLRDQHGRPMAVAEELPDDGAYRWKADDGRELGHVRRADGGVVVTWDACVQAFPFTKMVLLASVICT
jgi:hypothetical protein